MKVLRIFFARIVFAFWAWAWLAIGIDGPSATWAAVVLILLHVAASVGILLKARSKRWAILASALPSLVVLGWWLNLSPSNDREWLDEVAKPARAQINGDRVTIQNVRNFEYRSNEDYTPHWETREYDLSKLRGVDLFLSTWGSPLIAHTIASWDFGDGQHLAVSIETRKEVGEEYSAVLGFFRQFELYYVVADEQDLVGVRTNFRGEDVRLYHLKTKPALARGILLDYLDEINRLADEPFWYNALTHNCTTNIRHHVEHVAPSGRIMDWRVLVNGRLDELGYERGNVDTSLPFDVLRERSRISERARQLPKGADFSAWIREGLPGRRD